MDKSKFENKKEWRKFGLGLAIMLVFIGTGQLIFSKTSYIYLYSGAAIILLLSLISPALIKPFFIIFSYIGAGLGRFSTRLILIFTFYFLFTPLSFIFKILGKNFLNLRIDKKTSSYWLKREKTKFAVKDYES